MKPKAVFIVLFCLFVSLSPCLAQHGSEASLNTLNVGPAEPHVTLFCKNLDSSHFLVVYCAHKRFEMAPFSISKEGKEVSSVPKRGGWEVDSVYTAPNKKGKVKVHEVLLYKEEVSKDSTTYYLGNVTVIAETFYNHTENHWEVLVRPYDAKKDVIK